MDIRNRGCVPRERRMRPEVSPPAFLKANSLANADGWVDVDKSTLRHTRYPDVFSLGDCSNLPTSKTCAAIRKQAPVVVANLLAVRAGEAPRARSDGYMSCPAPNFSRREYASTSGCARSVPSMAVTSGGDSISVSGRLSVDAT
jgi:NADH dehydrogenase FAD-containing subunit